MFMCFSHICHHYSLWRENIFLWPRSEEEKEEMHPNKWRQKKLNKAFIRMCNRSIRPQPPSQQEDWEKELEEDWEKELEEISQRIEKQKQPPYGKFM